MHTYYLNISYVVGPLKIPGVIEVPLQCALSRVMGHYKLAAVSSNHVSRLQDAMQQHCEFAVL